MANPLSSYIYFSQFNEYKKLILITERKDRRISTILSINSINENSLVARIVTRPSCNQYLMLNENTESKQCHSWDVEEHNRLCLENFMIKMNWESINVTT